MSTTVSRVAPAAPAIASAHEAAPEGAIALAPAPASAHEDVPSPAHATAPAPGDASTPVAVSDALRAHHRLVAALRAALSAVAELDPDLLGSRTPAGRAAVPMAGTARAAIAALGGDAGTALTHAPGVVVGRDLAFATTQLAAAVPAGDATPSAARRLADLAAQAERHLGDLLRVVTRGA